MTWPSFDAAKREVPEAERPMLTGRECPEPSVNPQIHNKRDDRLERPSEVSEDGLGVARLCSPYPRKQVHVGHICYAVAKIVEKLALFLEQT